MTPDPWPTVRLGELLQRVRERVPVEAEEAYTLLGVRGKSLGVFVREEKSGENIKARHLFRVRNGLFIYNRLFASTGSFAVVQPQHDGCFVSNEFPHYKCDPSRLLADYLDLWFQLPTTVEMVADQCTGTTQSRLRWKERDLEATLLPLPPLEVQRRIVDLIRHVDSSVAAAEHARSSSQTALEALREELDNDEDATIDDVATVGSGPSWKSADESLRPAEGSIPVLKITNTGADGTFDLTEVVHVRGLPESTRVIDEQSLVLIRTNGNRDRIGNVYRPPTEVRGFAVSAFQMLAHVVPDYPRDLLYHGLARPSVQTQMSHAASGTTGLGNLSVRWLREQPVPVPADAVRLPALEAVEAATRGYGQLVADLRRFRAAALSDLLSASTHIPSSYDRLLQEESA